MTLNVSLNSFILAATYYTKRKPFFKTKRMLLVCYAKYNMLLEWANQKIYHRDMTK